jgi:hypothetical protein
MEECRFVCQVCIGFRTLNTDGEPAFYLKGDLSIRINLESGSLLAVYKTAVHKRRIPIPH